MPLDDTAAGTLLAIRVKSAVEQLTQIFTALGQVGIIAEVLDPEPLASDAIVVRIPTDRLIEAILAIEQHGFKHVRAHPCEAREWKSVVMHHAVKPRRLAGEGSQG